MNPDVHVLSLLWPSYFEPPTGPPPYQAEGFHCVSNFHDVLLCNGLVMEKAAGLQTEPLAGGPAAKPHAKLDP